MKKKEVIIFDFCETLVPFQTGDEFLKRLIIGHASYKNKITALIITNKIVKKMLSILNPDKKIRDYLLPKIKKIKKDKVNSEARKYAKTVLIPSINIEIEKILENYKINEKKILIVSAGYEEYLRCVFEDQSEIEIIGTKLEYENGFTTGKISGEVCFGEEKVNRIKNDFNFEIDKENSAVYSDCMSDFPMFSLVSKKKWLVKLPKNKNQKIEIKEIEFEI
jgi:phosphatidylglycerophosphatase C